MRKLLFAAVAALSAMVTLAEPVKVIFDTDMYTDFDDVGALACLHALADAGECEILGTIICSRGTPGLGMIEIMNHFYGRPELPVGVNKKLGLGPLERGWVGYCIYRDLVNANPKLVKHPTSDTAPDAPLVYRMLLAAQPDGSVTIISVGLTSNLRRLLETKPDAVSRLDGKTLVAKKVKAWYAMATRYPEGFEFNSSTDGESSRICFAEWPTPIYFADFHIGNGIKTGLPVAALDDKFNPVRDVFKRALRDCKEETKGHSSFDQVAVLAGVRGWERYYEVERGRMAIIDEKGNNRWTKDDAGNHYVLREKTPKAEIAKIIDELMAKAPKARK